MNKQLLNVKKVLLMSALCLGGSLSYGQYCTPAYSSGCVGGAKINNFSTTGGTDNISNLGSGCGSTATGYADHTDQFATASQLSTINFSATIIDWGASLKIWVDWNQDGDFTDAGEEVYASSSTFSSGTTVTGSFVVPLDAAVGETRLRVRAVESTTSYTSCSSQSWGEAEDYTFNVTEAPSCADVPLTEINISGSESVCPSSSFTITASGMPTASGLIIEWQSSPAGSGTWTTIAGATGTSLIVSAGITEPTDYRLIVTCDETGDSETSNEISVDLNDFTECYCTPVYLYGCTGGARINNFSTTGATVDISNLGTACASGALGYTDYSEDHVMDVTQLAVVSQTTTITSFGAGVKIWVDWDQDGIFESSELVASSTSTISAGSSFTSSFEVPLDAAVGFTKMRVRAVESSTSFDPCASGNWGETEDYGVFVTAAPACEDLDIAGLGASGPESVCPSVAFTVTSTGSPVASSLVRKWQSSPAGTDTWTDIAGATLPTHTVTAGITIPTDFRYIVICTTSGDSDTTDAFTVGINDFIDCYCAPVYTTGCVGGANIKDFSTSGAIVDVSNLESGCDALDGPGFSDYSDDLTVTAMQFSTISTTTGIGGWGAGVKIWVDWNQNGVFETSELVAFSSSTIAAGSSFTASFEVPLTAATGLTKMRVRAVEGSTTFDPCSSHTWGETEDYGFMVMPAVPCDDPEIVFPSSVGAVSSPPAVCGTGDVKLNIDGPMPLALGITYQWQTSSSESGPWTDISTDIATPVFGVDDVDVDTYFRCIVKCNGSPVLYSEPVFVESVIPEEPVLYEGQSCGPGAVTLSGTVGSGSIFWFTEPEGGTPFATGDIIETPPITSTTTFYAAGGAFPPAIVQVGTSSSSSSGTAAGPYNVWFRRSTMQLMYKASQIAAAGGTAGLIDEIRFNLTALPAYALPDYTMSIKMVPQTSMSSLVWQTSGFTDIFGGPGTSYLPTETGWQSYPLPAGTFWDGESHIIIQICWSQAAGISSTGGTHQYTTTTGQMLYSWTDAAGNSCGLTGSTTSTQLPNAIFNFVGCASDRVPVVAHVRDTPTIQIDVEDGEYCMINNMFEITTSPEQPDGSSYLWNTGATTSGIIATGSGVPSSYSYWVDVTNEWGCTTRSETLSVVLKPSPEVNLGADSTVCEGGFITLDAGSGAGNSYYWNTGETSQSINVEEEGTYNVLVQNSYGCIGLDTIHLEFEGHMPSVGSIITTNTGPFSFYFEPILTEYVVAWEWDFGDGTPVSEAEFASHTYAAPGTYTVTLTVYSTCGSRVYTTTTHILGVDDINLGNTNLSLYPNPAKETIIIESKDGLKMESVVITNVLGQVLYNQAVASPEKDQIQLSGLAAGMYTVRIQTDKGTVVRKFEVVK
jgi:PKD repeat protein